MVNRQPRENKYNRQLRTKEDNREKGRWGKRCKNSGRQGVNKGKWCITTTPAGRTE